MVIEHQPHQSTKIIILVKSQCESGNIHCGGHGHGGGYGKKYFQEYFHLVSREELLLRHHRILTLCFKVRNTATAAWRENTATATTASVRTGLGYRAKATEEAVEEEEDTTEEEEDTTEESNLLSRLGKNFGPLKM